MATWQDTRLNNRVIDFCTTACQSVSCARFQRSSCVELRTPRLIAASRFCNQGGDYFRSSALPSKLLPLCVILISASYEFLMYIYVGWLATVCLLVVHDQRFITTSKLHRKNLKRYHTIYI